MAVNRTLKLLHRTPTGIKLRLSGRQPKYAKLMLNQLQPSINLLVTKINEISVNRSIKVHTVSIVAFITIKNKPICRIATP